MANGIIDTEKGPSKKEQFLRHPSISTKRKGHPKETNDESRSKRYGIFSLGPSIQYFSSFVHQPRAESTTVPVVIITPSSPTRVAALLPPSSSLDLTDAIVEPEPPHLTQSANISEDTGEVPLASEKQVSVPPDVESDIKFDSWTISAPQEAVEPSFFLSESLQKITFEPIHCASHALSAVSDMFYDVPVWNTVEALGVGMPSYFTSTPPKRRRTTGSNIRDIENNYVEAIDPLEPPIHDAVYQNMDHLIPYPDVFDLDVYYDATIPVKKKLKKLCSRENALSLQSDGLINPPLCERLLSDGCKEKYGTATPSVTLISSPVAYHRDFESCRDNVSHSPSTLSLLNNASSRQSQEQHQIPSHSSFNHRHVTPLSESTNMSFKTSATTSSSTVYSIENSLVTSVKSQRQIRSSPASAHDRSNQHPQRSQTSLDSDSDVGSMDALYARLREACDSSISIPREIWEPVSF